MKSKIIFLILAFYFCLSADSASFPQFMQEMLDKSSDYQKLLTKHERITAQAQLRKSLSFMDINASYKNYENEIERVETDPEVKNTDISENDERWQIELSKQLFPKDFDATADAVKERFELYSLEQEIALTRVKVMEEILEDFINWWEAKEKISILEIRFETLSQQNNLLDNLATDNLVETNLLIEQLEAVEDCSDDLNKNRKTVTNMRHKYGAILDSFLLAFKQYKTIANLPDIAELEQQWKSWEKLQKQQSKPFYRYIKLKKITPYLPELNLSFSWNWRNTNQDWEISNQAEFQYMDRDQTETYPELGIEFTVPLDLWRNTQGKRNILQSYQRNLQILESAFSNELGKYVQIRETTFQAIINKRSRKKTIMDLYEKKLFIQQKFSRQSGPKIRNLEIAELKSRYAEIAFQKADFELHKEIFLFEFIQKDRL